MIPMQRSMQQIEEACYFSARRFNFPVHNIQPRFASA
jgi:hypothetical protein